jgi:20S proteasome alpha/beta subunit
MTIAAGFRAQDSIILCADTEVTLGADLKLLQGKVTRYRSDDCNLALVGAGHASFIKMTAQKIINAIGKTPTHFEIYGAIEQVVLEVFSKHVQYYPEDGQKPNFDLLIAAWTKDEGVELFRTDGTAVNYASWCECVGWGAALGSYLADKKYSILLTERECLGLAVYILQQAKDYVPYCGKESSIYVLRSNGELKSASSSKVVEQEAYFDEFEKIANEVFISGYLETDDKVFEEKLKAFCDGLKSMRTEQRVKRESASAFFGHFGPIGDELGS